MFTSIIVPIDGSKPAQNALQTACALAQAFEADLHLVHAPQIETMAFVAGSAMIDTTATTQAITEAGQSVLDAATALATSQGTPPASSTLHIGDAVEVILEIAGLNDGDLIVMGRRGLGSVASLFLGSVSQKVSQNAKCSVLTVSS